MVIRMDDTPMKKPTVRLKWEPRDLWIGVYWTREWGGWWDNPVRDGWSAYICILPCLPIHIRWGGIDWEAVSRRPLKAARRG